MSPELRVRRFLWAVFVVSIFLFVLVTRITPPFPEKHGDTETLPLLLTIVAVADLVLSFVIPRFMPGTGPGRDRGALLISLALCESVALMGFVLHYVTTWPYYWALFALALIGMLLHFPRQQEGKREPQGLPR